MSQQTEELTTLIQEKAGKYLRTVINYNYGYFDIIYIRDDIKELYDDDQIEGIVRELGVESIEKSIKEGLYSHGDLRSTIMWFEDGIELYIHTGKNKGFAVGLDAEAFAGAGPFADELHEVVDSFT